MAFLHRPKSRLLDPAPDTGVALAAGPRPVGAALREQREACGLALDDVAALLRIKPAYLAALEAGRPELLPGAAYAIGFLRTYADHLGLDSGEVLRRFKRDPMVLAAKPDLTLPGAISARNMPGSGMLLLALIMAVCGYGFWDYARTGQDPRPERVTEVPAELLPPNPVQREGQPRQPLATPAPPGEAPDSIGPSTPPTSPPAPVSQDRSQTVASNAAGGGSNNVVIRATSDSWIEIRGPGPEVLLARRMKAGESYRVPDRQGLSMRTGNAGGVQITVDGNLLPPLGRKGMARRNIALDPRALIAGSAVRH